MSDINYEAETLAAQHLMEALRLATKAHAAFFRVKTLTGDVSLKRKADDYMGSLNLVSDSGNREYSKLLDILDPS